MPSAIEIRALADREGRLALRATPNASADAILLPSQAGSLDLLVRTTATAEGGKATEAILRRLAPVSSIQIVRGETGRTKVVRIGQPRG